MPYLPKGALAFRRLPRMARPRSRVILVLTEVSSMNTSRPVVCRIAGWRSSIQIRRRSATSARAHSAAISGFFIWEPRTAEQPRDRRLGRRHPALGQEPRRQLRHRQVRRGLNRRHQIVSVVRQRPFTRRTTLPTRSSAPFTRSPRRPAYRRTHTHRKPHRRPSPRTARRYRSNHRTRKSSDRHATVLGIRRYPPLHRVIPSPRSVRGIARLGFRSRRRTFGATSKRSHVGQAESCCLAPCLRYCCSGGA